MDEDQAQMSQLAMAQALRAQPYASPNQHMVGNIQQMTNPDNEIYKMELALKGKILDKNGNEVQLSNPLLNKEGISSVIGQVQSIVSQVTIMSNFEERDIPMMIDFLGDTLARDLMMNRIKYEIVDRSARDKIYFMALSTTFVTMKRALMEGDRRFWKGSQQEITTRIEGMPGGKRKGGVLGILGGAWKGQ